MASFEYVSLNGFHLTELEVNTETRQVYVTPEALRRVLSQLPIREPTMASAEKIAEAFLNEYLQRELEIEDVIEFVDEEFPYYGGACSEVWKVASGLLSDHAQRFADLNN